MLLMKWALVHESLFWEVARQSLSHWSRVLLRLTWLHTWDNSINNPCGKPEVMLPMQTQTRKGWIIDMWTKERKRNNKALPTKTQAAEPQYKTNTSKVFIWRPWRAMLWNQHMVSIHLETNVPLKKLIVVQCCPGRASQDSFIPSLQPVVTLQVRHIRAWTAGEEEIYHQWEGNILTRSLLGFPLIKQQSQAWGGMESHPHTSLWSCCLFHWEAVRHERGNRQCL